MITTHINAVRVQKARFEAKKIGFAKAVARYIKRTAKQQDANLRLAFLNFPAPAMRKLKVQEKADG